ncbi:MAG: tetratricopeptide repeat protein [Candidatus Jettenia sp. CY-1]|nr:MAG: tetratricopeptide repeat protein [Candidatus Jettenia sp. CY-1]
MGEAENALLNAKTLNSENEWLWRHFAKIHRKRKNFDKEIDALEKVNLFGKVDSYDLNMLGIAYYNHGNYAKAVEYYRLSLAESYDTAPLFNMGLVFNNPEIS